MVPAFGEFTSYVILFKIVSWILVTVFLFPSPLDCVGSWSRVQLASTLPSELAQWISKKGNGNNINFDPPGSSREAGGLTKCLLLSSTKCLLWTHAQIQAIISKRRLLKSKRSDSLCSSVSCPYRSFLTAHPESNWQSVTKNKHLLPKMCLRFPSFCFGDFKKKKKTEFPLGIKFFQWIWSRLSLPSFTGHKTHPPKKWAAKEKFQMQSRRRRRRRWRRRRRRTSEAFSTTTEYIQFSLKNCQASARIGKQPLQQLLLNPLVDWVVII